MNFSNEVSTMPYEKILADGTVYDRFPDKHFNELGQVDSHAIRCGAESHITDTEWTLTRNGVVINRAKGKWIKQGPTYYFVQEDGIVRDMNHVCVKVQIN